MTDSTLSARARYLREALGIGIHDAVRVARGEALVRRIEDAASLADLKAVLVEIVEDGYLARFTREMAMARIPSREPSETLRPIP